MSNFEWYTDEDGTWEEVSPSRFQPQPKPRRWLYAPPTPGFGGEWLTEDGRYLSLIYHTLTNQSQVLDFNHLFSALEYDWSADSQWLLPLENGFLHLIEPATGQQKVFIHALSGCSYAAWVN